MMRVFFSLGVTVAVLSACGLECFLQPCLRGEGEGEGEADPDDEDCNDDGDCGDDEVCDDGECVPGGAEGEGEGEDAPITGCEISEFPGLTCTAGRREFMQIDCTSGDRYEFQNEVNNVSCFLNGQRVDSFTSEGFCTLDPVNNEADNNQMFLRIETGCGLFFE